ncbi:MAG TPA: FecR domain-containing protein, partial [Sphingobacteriaceae bacterium]
MELQEFNELFKKYEAGTLSEDERRLLEKWYNHYSTESKVQVDHSELEERLKSIAGKIPVRYQAAKIRRMYYRIAAAASVLIILTASAWWFYHRDIPQSQIVKNDIAPGSNKAVLTLADGRTIDLSESQRGIVVNDENINYQDGSNLTVVSNDLKGGGENALLKLTTPLGGTYQITLSDGTKVWLNAASTLKYPANFTEQVRKVEISGEAYFEVMPDANKPFKVFSKGQSIEVLGTVFNVQVYADEPEVKTTLVEGSVQVVNRISKSVRKLKPGEQSLVLNSNTDIARVDVSEYTAWKDGLFRYNNQPLEDIMRNMSRWYRVKVVYENESLKHERFVGMVSRYSNISAALTVLEEVGGARFSVEGNTVTVRK